LNPIRKNYRIPLKIFQSIPQPCRKISITITIAFENRSPINQTLVVIFQSRSPLRSIARKNQPGYMAFSDVNVQVFSGRTLPGNDQPVNRTLPENFQLTQ
jgi:hypothetical protein